MCTAIALDSTFEGTADGGNIAAERNTAVQFRVYGEEVWHHTVLDFILCVTATTEDKLLNNRAYSIVDAKTSFVPSVEGEKDGILRELSYVFRKE